MEKVKVTKEQAEALRSAELAYDNDEIVKIHTNNIAARWNTEGRQVLNTVPLDTIIRAVYIGYEVELTPHEKILELYEFYNLSEDYTIGKRTGIANTLDILGITIEGIND